MRGIRFRLFASLMLVGGAVGVAPATAGLLDDGLTAVGSVSPVVQQPGALSSDNITYIGTIPFDSSAVSAKVREVGDQRLLFVSGVKGLSIYDIDDPASPTLVSFLPLPHSQNEDVEVSEDGTRAIIAADGGLPAPNPVTAGLHIIDTSDPANPRWQAWLDGAGQGTNHTATCADAACEWIYGNRGLIFHVPADVTSGDDIEVIGSWFDLDERVTGSHALNRSVHTDPTTGAEVQLLISDSTPRLVIDATDPANPVVLATSDPADHAGDGLLQHNNARPNAGDWTPRAETAPGPGRGKGPEQRAGRGPHPALAEADASGTDPFGGHLRPGELVIGNSESNVQPQCSESSGGLTTFSIADFDKGAPMETLHEFRPVNGTWTDGNPPANALGCSGHWFDIQDGDNLIAASWYEHGVKIIEVLPDYSMREVGFFQPVATNAGAAQWVVDDDGTEYIYSTDYGRGLDILRFDRDPALRPSAGQIEAAAVAAVAAGPSAIATAERLYCTLEMQR